MAEAVKIPDVNMVQDQKIAQQVVDKALKSNKDFTINVINIGQVNNLKKADDVDEVEKGKDGFGLKEYIDALPQPRLENLVRNAFETALTAYPTQRAGANWLGISPRTMCYHNKLLQEKEKKR